MINRTGRLYIGVANDLHHRVYQSIGWWPLCKYVLERLMYFADNDEMGAAIARENELKGGRCSGKSP